MRQHLMADAAYNVFQRKQEPALRCAVRQDCPVPPFLWGEVWEFWGIATLEEPSPGFQPKAANEAMKFTGYYLFTALDCPTSGYVTQPTLCLWSTNATGRGSTGEHG